METRYPKHPGFKADGTSQAAAVAEAPRAATLRERALEVLIADGPRTADEVAAALQESILAVRPRLSELRALGQVRETTERRANSSGHKAVVWAAVLPQPQRGPRAAEPVAGAARQQPELFNK